MTLGVPSWRVVVSFLARTHAAGVATLINHRITVSDPHPMPPMASVVDHTYPAPSYANQPRATPCLGAPGSPLPPPPLATPPRSHSEGRWHPWTTCFDRRSCGRSQTGPREGRVALPCIVTALRHVQRRKTCVVTYRTAPPDSQFSDHSCHGGGHWCTTHVGAGPPGYGAGLTALWHHVGSI